MDDRFVTDTTAESVECLISDVLVHNPTRQHSVDRSSSCLLLDENGR